jgi:hypothetical protein
VNQIRQLVYTAPDELRERFVGVPSWRIAEGVAILRVHADADPVRMATKSALGTLGRRAVALGEEGKRLDVLIARLVDKVAPELVELVGLGPDTAALLLIAAGKGPISHFTIRQLNRGSTNRPNPEGCKGNDQDAIANRHAGEIAVRLILECEPDGLCQEYQDAHNAQVLVVPPCSAAYEPLRKALVPAGHAFHYGGQGTR